jgi:hypothetical protein
VNGCGGESNFPVVPVHPARGFILCHLLSTPESLLGVLPGRVAFRRCYSPPSKIFFDK